MEVYEGKVISMTKGERNNIHKFTQNHISLVAHTELLVEQTEKTCKLQCSFNTHNKGNLIFNLRKFIRDDANKMNVFLEIFEREDALDDETIVIRCSAQEYSHVKRFVQEHIAFTDYLDRAIGIISGDKSCSYECNYNTMKRAPLTIQAQNLIGQARETVNPLIALFDQENA